MKDKKRIYYSRYFKRKVLFQTINGEKFEDILRRENIDVDFLIQKDKKYCSKLLHKWRNEVYKNNELINFLNCEINNDTLEDEINFLNDNQEIDTITLKLKDKMASGVKEYNKIKNYIIEKYQNKNKIKK